MEAQSWLAEIKAFKQMEGGTKQQRAGNKTNKILRGMVYIPMVKKTAYKHLTVTVRIRELTEKSLLQTISILKND